MKRKPNVTRFIDFDGYFTVRVETIDEARALIEREYMEDDGGAKFRPEDVTETTMYWHRRCGFYRIESNECQECNVQFGAGPRKTFVYYP